MNKLVSSVKVIFIFILFSISIITSNAIAERIKKIDIQGNSRVETATILEYLGVSVGSDYSQETKNNVIKNLYSTAFFEDITVDFASGKLKVFVVETPLVSKVVFNGNYKIGTKMLSKAIITSPGDSFEKASVRTDLEKIRAIYKAQGRFAARVESKIEKLENNRVKVIFDINEGPKTVIKRIYFVGNENYEAYELKKLILTKEVGLFGGILDFLSTDNTYNPEKIEHDKYLLQKMYNSAGFADFEVLSVTADLSATKDGFIVTYSLKEGQKYVFGDITLQNNLKNVSNDELMGFITQKQGKTFDLHALEKMCESIKNYLSLQGYPEVSVKPATNRDKKEGIAYPVIVVDKAPKVFINKININGNVKTEDHVIRRQFDISEGDLFNKDQLDRGERNVRNLDFFETVEVTPVATEKEDRYDIDIKVADKSTSSLGIDIGYDTSGGPFSRLNFLERNLLGTGRSLNAGIQVGNKSISYFGGITDPHFLDRDLLAGIKLSRSENGRGSGFSGTKQQYESISNTGKFFIGYDIKDDLSHTLEYYFSEEKLKSPNPGASIFIQEQLGRNTTSAISHTLTYDVTDSSVIPKNGYVISGSQEFAGVGGNVSYLKHDLDAKYFKSFFSNQVTLQLSASGGDIHGTNGKKVRISDRFNLGGHTLRGFAPSGIGPRDKKTEESLGGQKYYTLSAELRFPLGLPDDFNVLGAVFFDAGALWDVDSKITTAGSFHNDQSMRHSVGFGIEWRTRLAPIRLDWGFPITKKKYDEKQIFNIRFSTQL